MQAVAPGHDFQRPRLGAQKPAAQRDAVAAQAAQRPAAHAIGVARMQVQDGRARLRRAMPDPATDRSGTKEKEAPVESSAAKKRGKKAGII